MFAWQEKACGGALLGFQKALQTFYQGEAPVLHSWDLPGLAGGNLQERSPPVQRREENSEGA